MRLKAWFPMLLLVPLLAQAISVAPSGACTMAGPAGNTVSTGQDSDHHATLPNVDQSAGDHPAHHASQHFPGPVQADCCTGSDATACPGGACQLGGCTGAYLVSLQYELTAPRTPVQHFFHASLPQPSPLYVFFRPPIV